MANPIPVEVAKSASVYDPTTDTWTTAWWNVFTQRAENKHAAINISSAGDNTIIPAASGKRIIISTITFTVAAAVNVTLKAGASNISGPMDFGGTSEPRGIVINLGFQGLELDDNLDFVISLSSATLVSGFVVYALK